MNDDHADGSRGRGLPALSDTADGRVRAPAATPGAVIVGALLGLLLLVLAGIAIRDLVVRAGWVDGPEWLRGAAHWSTDVGWHGWTWAVAAALIAVGLGMVWSAVKPRRRNHLPVGASGVLWTLPRAVARRCSAAVADVPGVDRAVTLVGRRTVTVTVSGDPDVVDVESVTTTARAVLDGLGITSRVTVKVRATGTRKNR
ncbi:MAG: DUF6286 domain-containing protein [Gordonia sp. (in: high G+C Gram-positive bacteria)]|uniref:DUF6286 domain-containing protein n=1 Tax=Gordonia sp. (in: high G+C Gram-positive bacteria) TaxID=84139 RepID=UPI0039E4C57B